MSVPIVSEEARRLEAERESATRHVAITTKLTDAEADLLNGFADAKGVPRSEVVRNAVLEYVGTGPASPAPTPELTEIVGIRLLLINLLRPLVTGKTLTVEELGKISKDVKNMKRAAAAEILSGERE